MQEKTFKIMWFTLLATLYLIIMCFASYCFGRYSYKKECINRAKAIPTNHVLTWTDIEIIIFNKKQL
jgi:hypothetical protein